MTAEDRLREAYACPICGKFHDKEGDEMTKDPRWAEPVHVSCVRRLAKWPGSGTSPDMNDPSDYGAGHNE